MRTILRVFTSRKMAAMLLLGFASGLPLALTSSLLQAWMSAEGVNLGVIGLFSLVGLPYSVKFLWAPVMDRFVPHWGGREFLGRRRGWVLLTQVALFAVISFMALLHPSRQTVAVAAVALVLSFFSASQDTVIDAYRADILEKDELGAGAAVFILGYRFGMLASGAFALILSDHMPWRAVYFVMAVTMALGVFGTAIAPEPRGKPVAPRRLIDAFAHPFSEFFRRHGWAQAFEKISFVILYKVGVVMAMALTTPFVLAMGFSRTDIGAVTKGFGLISAIGGSLIAGALMVPLGLERALWIFGGAQAVATLAFLGLAHAGHSYAWMITSIALDNLCSGMGNVAYMAFLMRLCDKRYSATQYALLSSLMALTRVLAGAPTGYLVLHVGWERFFLISTLASAPGLAMLLRYRKWRIEA